MKKNGENRTQFHTVRLTPAEAEEVADHAEACGLSISALLRRRVLGLALPAGSAPAINLAAWRELSSLASNFNQVSKHANEQKIQQGTAVLDLGQVKSLLQRLDATLDKVRLCLLGITSE